MQPPAPPSGPALRRFSERRVRGLPEAVVRGLFAWKRGERPVDLLFEVPAARRVLALQARARRCVCLIEDAAARAHSDPRHPDGLTFALHDLRHLEKIPLARTSPREGRFLSPREARSTRPRRSPLPRELEVPWRAERD